MNIHSIYRPILLFFRRKRMAMFVKRFGIRDESEILDVGGATFNWEIIDEQPKVILLNVDESCECTEGRFSFVKGDARDLPYEDRQYQVVYSNSVIEHVGGPEDQQRFADEIRRVGVNYFVQTPNRYFPVEPHFLTLGLQFLPFAIKRRLLRWCSVWGLVTKPDQQGVDEFIRSIRLLTVKEMRALFPDAEIVVERFLLMPKSIIAIRLERSPAAAEQPLVQPRAALAGTSPRSGS